MCGLIDEVGGDEDELPRQRREDDQVLLRVGGIARDAIDHQVPRLCGTGNDARKRRMVVAVGDEADDALRQPPLAPCYRPDLMALCERDLGNGAAQEATATNDQDAEPVWFA